MKLNNSWTLSEIAEFSEQRIGARLAELGSPDLAFDVKVIGDESITIQSICPIEALEPGCLTFATGREYLERAENSDAAAVIIPPTLTSSVKPVIQAPEPRLVFTVLMESALESPSLVPANPDSVRFKDRSSAEIGSGTVIGDWCYIGADVRIGCDCKIYPQVYIDDHVTIGDGSILYPGVRIFRHATIGRHVIIHAGAVIGDDGFGFNQVVDLNRGRILHVKNEHAGSVTIEDHVEIGSQTCVDRGLIKNTVIGEGSKIDNLVQIAHNDRIGRDCLIMALAGISGRSHIGDRAIILGLTGITDGVNVGEDAIIVGMSGVMSDVPAGRTAWSGRPVQKAKDEWKIKALMRRELPRLREFFSLLKRAESFDDLKNEFFKKKKTGA